jgi:hypothetical protein
MVSQNQGNVTNVNAHHELFSIDNFKLNVDKISHKVPHHYFLHNTAVVTTHQEKKNNSN